MKHTEQFSVIYSIGGQDIFNRYSCAIKVEIDDAAEPFINHRNLTIAVAEAHNQFEAAKKITGIVTNDLIVMTCVVRLSK